MAHLHKKPIPLSKFQQIVMMITSLSQLDPEKTYTYADYLRWVFDERVELLRGRLSQMAAPNRSHQSISGNLFYAIKKALWRSECKVYSAPFDVRLTHYSHKKNKEINTVVQPDICVICDPSKLDAKGCVGAPDLIVEILSPGNSRKELKDKFEIYQESGVLEYWIVSPIEKSVQVFRLNEAGQYYGIAPFVEGDDMTTPIIPNMVVSLTEVFAE